MSGIWLNKFHVFDSLTDAAAAMISALRSTQRQNRRGPTDRTMKPSLYIPRLDS